MAPSRALHALNIKIICANSSQAKGRVERANKTLQDRLVKELRLAGVSSIEAGNAFLPSFIADYNARFAKPPANSKDLHRPMASRETLEDAFTWHVERTLSRALTLQYDNRTFDKIRHVKEAAVVENKRLGPLLEIIHQQQLEREPEKRSRKGPKRRDQTGHMFSVG